MCHLILALPVVALPLLWLLPPAASVPIYAALVVLAVGVYWLALKAMRAPVTTGAEALLRAVGTVRSVDGQRAAVWVASELWLTESSPEPLAVGDRVEVVGLDGLRLQVRTIDRSHSRPTSPIC
jgi:membrane protein implicated in regulation of membrane protease activity